MEMDDAAITAMEQFVQQELSTRIKSNETKNIMTDFFGIFYADKPEKFQFQIGDKLMMKRLAVYLRELNKENSKFPCFQITKKKIEKLRCKGLIKTTIGFYYGTNDIMFDVGNSKKTEKKSNCSTKSETELHKMLYDKVLKTLRTDTHIDQANKFLDTMVKVSTVGCITGHVECVYCRQQKQVYYDATYWVTSNFVKHLNLCSKKIKQRLLPQQPKVNFEEEYVFVEVQNDNELIEENLDHSSNMQQDNIQSGGNVDENSYDLLETSSSKIQTSVLSGDEHFIYFQICEQNSKMRAASLTHIETEIEYTISFDGVSSSVISANKIAADGNCLLGALAHQLFQRELESPAQIELTTKLRMDSVNYIKENINIFEQHIVWREDFDEYALGDDMQSKIDYFLNELSKPGHLWGGTEMLIAISRLHSVNIIIINQGGSLNMVEPFNFSYKRCAVIIYCATTTKNVKGQKRCQINRNHYNSVCKIDQKDIFFCMSKIIKTQKNEVEETVDLV